MKEAYKQRVYDYITSVDSRINLLDKMIDGVKKSDPNEAKRYIKESQKALSDLREIISIS
jgi:hypothetical protein